MFRLMQMEKIKINFNNKIFFVVVLALYVAFFLYLNYDKNTGDLSSDIWMMQYISIQQNEGAPWSYVPPAYIQEKFYLAFPIFYLLNPGLMGGMLNYLILALIIITAIYLINGLVIKKIFNNWILAIIVALSILIPRYIFSTHIGMLDFRNLRGLVFAFPFYLLLSHYWIIYGIKDKRKNVILAILAALLVYLYPPVGIIIVPMLILTALIVYRKKYFKEILIFTFIYLALSSLFWCGHFSNPSSSMLDIDRGLTSEGIKLQRDILNYRIPDGSIRGIDFGTFKRTIWDGFPLLVTFLLSLYLVKKYRNKLKEKHLLFFKISVIFTVILLGFVISVELVNNYLYFKDKLPVFIEHLRLMRILGFIWIAQAILVIFIYYRFLKKKFIASALALILIFSPLSFSAPLVRSIVRTTAPESIRVKYNLAPVALESETREFKYLEEMALWARENLTEEHVKVFVFDDFQNEFKFKVLSRRDTNLTAKEGSLWITSGFENSRRWYEERIRYEKVTEEARDFKQIVDFAKELNCTHTLLPKGEFQDLYEETKTDDTKVLYSNKDYKLLEIEQ